jgi:hypothetical protein
MINIIPCLFSFLAAEYTDHMMLGEDFVTRLDSIWFGRGEQLKLRAFNLAQRMMMWPESGNPAINDPGHYV